MVFAAQAVRGAVREEQHLALGRADRLIVAHLHPALAGKHGMEDRGILGVVQEAARQSLGRGNREAPGGAQVGIEDRAAREAHGAQDFGQCVHDEK